MEELPLLIGTYERSVDCKRRVSLPPKLMGLLSDRARIKGRRLDERTLFSVIRRREGVTFLELVDRLPDKGYSEIYPVKLDSRKRMLIEKRVAEYFQRGGNCVVFVGRRDHIDIYAENDWDRINL